MQILKQVVNLTASKLQEKSDTCQRGNLSMTLALSFLNFQTFSNLQFSLNSANKLKARFYWMATARLVVMST